MSLKNRLKRLEREAEQEMIVIPQTDGTVKKFPHSDGMEALLALVDGRDHPLAEAARSSPDPRWEKSVYSAFPIDREGVEDLSEP